MRGIRLTSSPVQIFFSPILPQKDVANPSHHANAVFGLSRGLVRLYKSLPDGRRQVLAFAVPGDLLGMPLRERHTCSADAIGEVAALRWVNPQVAAIKCLSCRKADTHGSLAEASNRTCQSLLRRSTSLRAATSHR